MSTGTDWRIAIAKGIFAGSVAVGVYYLLKAYQDYKNKEKSIYRDKIDDLISDMKMSIERRTKKIEEKIDAKRASMEDDLAEALASVKDLVVSKEMQEAFDSISSLVEKVNKFKELDLSRALDSPSFLLLLIIKRIQEEKEESMRGGQDNLGEVNLFEEDITSVRRIGSHAVKVYAASSESTNEAIAETMKVNKDDILFTYFEDQEGILCPQFMIFKDNIEETIVLAIRGTSSFRDLVTDIVMEEEAFLGGFAHRGILEGSLHILRIAQDEIKKALTSNPQYKKLVVTGHSLGAGTAELIYLQLKLGEAEYIPEGTEIHCLALAPPPVFRPGKDLPEEMQNNIKILIFNNDLVPRLSLANLALLVVKLRQVDGLKIPTHSLISIIANRISEVEENILKTVRESLAKVEQDMFPYLHHPGKIIHIKSENEKIRLLFAESATFATSLLLLENMLTDHQGKGYQAALDSI